MGYWFGHRPCTWWLSCSGEFPIPVKMKFIYLFWFRYIYDIYLILHSTIRLQSIIPCFLYFHLKLQSIIRSPYLFLVYLWLFICILSYSLLINSQVYFLKNQFSGGMSFFFPPLFCFWIFLGRVWFVGKSFSRESFPNSFPLQGTFSSPPFPLPLHHPFFFFFRFLSFPAAPDKGKCNF